MIITRRTLFGLIAAPAVIRVIDLMPVKALIVEPFQWDFGPDQFTIEGRVNSDATGNEWQHLAVEGTGSEMRFYQNGVRVPYDAKLFELLGYQRSNIAGGNWTGATQGALLDDVRLTRGVARYSG